MRAAILLVSAFALAACSRGADARDHDGAGGGAATKRDFQVEGFEKVSLRGAHDVIVIVGPAASVRAEGDAETIERLDITVEDGELVIGSKRKRDWSFGVSRSRRKVTIHVTVPALRAATIAGSGDMRIDKVQGDSFAGEIAGSGDMDIADLRVGSADLSIAGSGGITAKGAAQSSSVSIAGSGDVDTSGLTAKTAKISVMGSGDVRANASDTA